MKFFLNFFEKLSRISKLSGRQPFWFFVVNYDMHGHWESETGHQALAHKISSDDRLGGTTNIEWILDNWLDMGADPSKLFLGKRL